MATRDPATVTAAQDGDTRLRIIDAAYRCFSQSGISATTMEDIGVEAGVVRQTVYNYFPNKRELLAEVVAREARRVNALALESLDWDQPAADLIADAELALLRAARENEYTGMLLGPTGVGLVREVVNESRLLAQIGRAYWMPILGALQANGSLRPGLDLVDVVTWLNFVHFVLVARSDHFGSDPAAVRRVVIDYVAPALVAGGAPGAK